MAIVSTNISHKYIYQDDIKRYDFTFKLLDDNSLDVYRVRDNVEVKLITDIDYSIEYNEQIGGYITLTDTGCSKFINGDILGILTSPNFLQELKTDEHNVLYKKDIENSLDKLTQLYLILSAKISKLPLPPLYLDDADVSYSDIVEIYNESKDYKDIIDAIKTEIDQQSATISAIASDFSNKFATDEQALAGVATDKIVAPKQVKDMIGIFGDIKYYPENSIDLDDINFCNHSFIALFTQTVLGEMGDGLLLNLHSDKFSAQLIFKTDSYGLYYRVSRLDTGFDKYSWRQLRCTNI